MDDRLARLEGQIARLKKAIGVNSDTALGQALGISQSGIFNAKRRGSVPHKWFVFTATNYGASLEWLISGTGGREAGQSATAVKNDQDLKRRLLELERQNEALKEENEQLKQELKEARHETVAAYKQALSTVHEFALKGGAATSGAPASALSAPSACLTSED